uniref:Uncharacterized protein n=1 Tax=Ciona intestinalis TaxID=7719 RepID=H2XNT2_CIOIN
MIRKWPRREEWRNRNVSASMT